MLVIIFSYFDVVLGPKLLWFYPKKPKLENKSLTALLNLFDLNFIEHPFNFKFENECFLNYIVEIPHTVERGKFYTYMISFLIDDEDIFNEVRYISIKYLQEFVENYKKKPLLLRDIHNLIENNKGNFQNLQGGIEFLKDLKNLYKKILNQTKFTKEEEIISDTYFNLVANVFEANSLPIIVINPKNKISLANLASEGLFGFKSEELQRKSILEFISKKDHTLFKTNLKSIPEKGVIENVEIEIKTKDFSIYNVVTDLNYLGGGLGVSLIFKKKSKFPINILKNI